MTSYSLGIMNKRERLFFLIALGIVFSACGNVDTSVIPTSTLSPRQATFQVNQTQNAIYAAMSAVINAQTPVPVTKTQRPPSPTLSPIPVLKLPDLAGLIYRYQDALWQFDSSGSVIQYASCAGWDISPDGNLALYESEGDIWKVDLRTCQAENLTNTIDIYESFPQWWSTHPKIVLYMINPSYSFGTPAYMNVSGEDNTIILDGDLYSLPAPSPNGVYIAIETGLLYEWGEGIKPLDLDIYVSPDIEIDTIANPAWSPDGSQLAWLATLRTSDETDWELGYLIMDFSRGESKLLNRFPPPRGDGWFPIIAWSPDGNWIAVHICSGIFKQESNGVWIVAIEEDQQIQMTGGDCSGGPAVWWNLNSQRIVFDNEGYWYANVGEWQPIWIGLPDEAWVIDWREPIQ